MKSENMGAGILFDLDGTLLDSAPEYIAALNQLLREDCQPEVDFAIARNHVSRGAYSLLRLGYGNDLSDERYSALRPRFLENYEKRAPQSSLFPAVDSVLNELDANSIPWGIVTNKPKHLTDIVVGTILSKWKIGSVVASGSTEFTKPHPEPVLHACRALRIEPPSSFFIGDARVDVQAGQAAGMSTVIAEWGYFSAADGREWNADRTIREPAEIPLLL